jgi:AraC-like DNA-binding protein
VPLEVTHYRIPRLDDLELLYFPQVTEAYPAHFHQDYAICFMTSGNVQTSYRGSKHPSYGESFTLMNPGELHAGGMQQGERASYFSFYPSVSMIEQLMQDSFDKQTLPYFTEPVIADVLLQVKFTRFVQAIGSRLAIESCFLDFLEYLIGFHSDGRYQRRQPGHESNAVHQIKDYLQTHFDHQVTLDHLATLVGLNRSYLVRIFKRATGLPPHRYLLHLRLQEARRRLSSAASISQIALETGFADQSHLTRAFKAVFAMTPAQYAKVNFVQDSSQSP